LVLFFCQDAEEITAQEFWTGSNFNYGLSSKIKLGAEAQVRLSEGFQEYNGYLGEAGISYKIADRIKVKGSYRYTNKAGHHDSEIRPTNNRERITADLNIEMFEKVLPLKYRIRYQYAGERNTSKQYNFIRSRLNITYPLHKSAKPYLNFEAFFRLDEKNEFRALRYVIGLDSKISDQLAMKSFFMIESEINITSPKKYYIVGAILSIDLEFNEKD